MLIPQIQFRYSLIYDDVFRSSFTDTNDTYPSVKDIDSFMTKVEKVWREYEKKIFTTLREITQLNWKEEKIICYVVGRTIAFSDPMTIPAYIGYEDYAVDVITHELIHRLFTQEGNYEQTKPFWENLKNKYKKYPENASIHIPVEAVHTKLYKTLFDDKRLKRDRDFLSEIEDYKIAWEVVGKEGHETIITKLLEERR